tara:strand:+ start:960 stop:1790 length:831 start_codon:yes stop_codon:yes gene_type:complete
VKTRPRLRTEEFTALSGERLHLKIPEGSGDASVYFLALHKSGSVLQTQLINEITRILGLASFALPEELFRRGVNLSDCPLELLRVLERPGYWFHGFRSLWLLEYVRRFRDSRKLVLVRDPRDMVVSYYFSVKRSHAVPADGKVRESVLNQREAASRLAVNEFVRNGKADFIIHNMRTYARLVEVYECDVIKYEDYIYDKPAWIRRLCDSGGTSPNSATVERLAKKHDVWPDEERPESHIRQVAPGNHQNHLDEQTLAGLERRFNDVFRSFGYEPNQ